MDDAIVDRIEFIYIIKIGSKGNTKNVSIGEGNKKLEGTIRENDDPSIPPRPLTLGKFFMKCCHRRGDTVEVDVNCDSAYMLRAMDRVGESIRRAYHWISRTEKCYLVMDNAGGHGTNEAIKEYVRMLDEKWNVETIFQVPRSPYTNALDLGVWCALQSRVETEHYGKRCEVQALSNTVMETWNQGHLDCMIEKVCNRIQKVLVLIVEGKGKNDLVETKRGKKIADLDLPIDLTVDDAPVLLDEPIEPCVIAEEEPGLEEVVI